MTRTLTVVLLCIMVALIVLLLASAGPAMTQEPSPSPSSSATCTPSPAPQDLVVAARKWQRGARAQRKVLGRVRACFGLRGPVRLAVSPERGATAEVWTEALRKWRHQARDWRGKVRDGREKMQDPGGGGWERWRPLVRWVWPRRCVETVIQIMRYESSGRPRVLCGGYKLPKGAGDGEPDSRAGGLMQLKPAPRHWADPEFNLRYAYVHKYLADQRSGGNGWRPWAGCRAFD